MKSLLFFVLLISFACNKPATDLGSEYQYLIGEWESVDENPANRLHITFKKNGKITFQNKGERGSNFKINRLYSKDYAIDGMVQVTYSQVKKGKDLNILQIIKKIGSTDTLKLPKVSVFQDTLLGSVMFHKIN